MSSDKPHRECYIHWNGFRSHKQWTVGCDWQDGPKNSLTPAVPFVEKQALDAANERIRELEAQVEKQKSVMTTGDRSWLELLQQRNDLLCKVKDLEDYQSMYISKSDQVVRFSLKNTELTEQLSVAREALKSCHRKHNQGCDDIGWSELADIIHNSLAEIMGDKEYCTWLAKLGSAKGDEA